MNYRIIYNNITRTYRIRKLRNDSWAHTFWDLGMWDDSTFETRFKLRALYHVWRLNRMDAVLKRYQSWQ